MKTPTTPMSTGFAAAAIAASALLLVACGDKKDKPATQTAARVNKEEITVHQINFVLQQQRGLRADQTEAASRQVLERLIDQELALQKAGEMKIDRDPRVAQQLDAARREIISRAYFEKVGEGASRPSSAEVRKYYDDNPALFRERRVYQLQELMVAAAPEQMEPLRAKLAQSKSVAEFTEWLNANGIKFASNQAVRAAEQLPMGSVAQFAGLKDGQSVVNPTPTGVQVVVVNASRLQPVDEERARPAIEQFLLNERKRRIISDDLKALRSGAKVQYVGKFADAAASAPDASGPTAADVAASAARGLPEPAPAGASTAAAATSASAASSVIDTSTINKGLGIK